MKMKKLNEIINGAEYTPPVVVISSLDKEDIITTSWGLPEVGFNDW